MVSGVGLGFRIDIAKKLIELEDDKLKFIEFAPENWMKMGGCGEKKLDAAADKYPVMCHGLSLSIGSPDDLDFDFLKDLKEFFDIYNPEVYSEHLSYSKCDNAHLYDLLPIPFREDAVKHVSGNIRKVQDFLGRQIAIENVSY